MVHHSNVYLQLLLKSGWLHHLHLSYSNCEQFAIPFTVHSDALMDVHDQYNSEIKDLY